MTATKHGFESRSEFVAQCLWKQASLAFVGQVQAGLEISTLEPALSGPSAGGFSEVDLAGAGARAEALLVLMRQRPTKESRQCPRYQTAPAMDRSPGF